MGLLAWRNLLRNRMRTGITGSAIALTFSLMLLTFGIQESEYLKMHKAAAKGAGGMVLIHAEGYWADRSSGKVIHEEALDLGALEAIDGVERAIPRVIIQGLVSSPYGNAGVNLEGIDKEAELALRDPGKHVRGAFLQGRTSRGRAPIVLGSGVAKKLKVDLGDKVVLTLNDPAGEMQQALFQVQGILESGSRMLDDVAAFTTIPAAQKALGAPGALTQVGIMLTDDRERHRIKGQVAAMVPAGMEVLTWDEAIPEMTTFIEIDRRMGTIMMYVIMLVVTFGIMNTFMMVVLERIRELGLLGAIGMSPRRVGLLLMTETLWLALGSLAVGLALGTLFHLYFLHVGLDLSESFEEGFEMTGVLIDDMVMRSHVDVGRWLEGFFGVLILVMLSGVYPAWRASRLTPTEAMRTYE